jgi:hypothetical protein
VELVFAEEQATRLLRAAEEQDVAAGGVFSAGPGGIQVWSEPWNGDGGTSSSSVQLGSVEWTANAPPAPTSPSTAASSPGPAGPAASAPPTSSSASWPWPA